MKNKATGFLKNLISAVTAMAKARALALKSKTSALRTRLIIFSLLRNKKLLMGSISSKLQGLMGHHHDKKSEEDIGGQSKGGSTPVVNYHRNTMYSLPSPTQFLQNAEDDDQDSVGYGCNYEEEAGDSKYPDLTHSLFDSKDLDFEDPGGSVIDLVKNSKQDGEEFRLEDEIDRVADLFIKRFHRQMRLQKQLSIKNHQEMLQSSA